MPFVPKGASVLEKPKSFVPEGTRPKFAPQDPLEPDISIEPEVFGLNAYRGLTAPEAESMADKVWDTAIQADVPLSFVEQNNEWVKNQVSLNTKMAKRPRHIESPGGFDILGIQDVFATDAANKGFESLKNSIKRIPGSFWNGIVAIPKNLGRGLQALGELGIKIQFPEASDEDIREIFSTEGPPPEQDNFFARFMIDVARTPDMTSDLLGAYLADRQSKRGTPEFAVDPFSYISDKLFETLPTSVAAIGVGILFGPGAGLGFMGASEFGGAAERQAQAGGSIDKAFGIGVLSGLAEIGGEMLVLPKFIKGFKAGIPARQAFNLVLENATQEGVTGFVQTFLEVLGIQTTEGVEMNDAIGTAFVEGVKAIPENAWIGGLTAGVLSGATSITSEAFRKAGRKLAVETAEAPPEAKEAPGKVVKPTEVAKKPAAAPAKPLKPAEQRPLSEIPAKEFIEERFTPESIAARREFIDKKIREGKDVNAADAPPLVPLAPSKPLTPAEPTITPPKAKEAVVPPTKAVAPPSKPAIAPSKPAEAKVEPKKQNFTQFAKEHGFVDDFSVLEHGLLGESGKISKRAKDAELKRQIERGESNLAGHDAFRAAILKGEVIDSTGKTTKADLEREIETQKQKKISGRIAQIDAQIQGLIATGKSKKGTIRPSIQKEIDTLNAEKAALVLVPKAEAKVEAETFESERRAELKILKAKKSQTRATEIKIERIEKQLKENFGKWQIGQGVGWRVVKGQTNRGLRIVELRPDTHEAVIQFVKDVGVLADFEQGKTHIVDTIDLVRDKKFDTPTGKLPGGRQAGAINVEVLQKVTDKMLALLEPAKLAQREVGKEVTAGVIKAAHRADVARIEFNELEFDNLEGTIEQWGEKLGEYSEKIQHLLMLSRGKPASPRARNIQAEALRQLKKEAPELVGTRQMINRVADFNYDFLTDVVGDKIGYVEDYFYGVYKDPAKVSNLLDYWKTTEKFTKKKVWPTFADARAFDPEIELRNPNPVENLKAEYLGIARLSGMVDLFNSLKETGEFIKASDVAPPDWLSVHDPVFDGFRVSPFLAKTINSLISTNKITRVPFLNFIRQANNVIRNLKFFGSFFHGGVIIEQSIVDTGIQEVLIDPTAGLKAVALGFKPHDPRFKTPMYKQYIENGGGHRYSIESQAVRSFRRAMDRINKAGSTIAKKVAYPALLPLKITEWMFESYIPEMKYNKYLLNVRVQEQKLKRSLTDAERQEIIKEGQNFYGEMNERLFGRSGTVTTILRFPLTAPGWFEGNFRSVLKAVTQWGQSGNYNAQRSRRNIVNSMIFATTIATVGTLIMTGKPPKRPEKLEDIPDLFKIDTGKVDAKGNKIMIETMKTGKDYWLLTGNIVKGTGRYFSDLSKRFGGMTAPAWDVMSDMNQMLQGKAVYDWKGDRVIEITDPFIQKVLKLAIHELEKVEPIPLSVFQQAKQKGMDTMLAAAMALSGVRTTKTEKAKREQEVLSKIFSLRDQQERLFFYLGKLDSPREAVKDYNATVMRILDNPNTPLEVKEEFEEKLIIDIDRLVSNKVYSLLSEQATLAEKMSDPKATDKEIKEHDKSIAKNQKWLENLKVPPSEYRKQVEIRESLHRKLIKEIKPEDLRDDLKTDLAKFYTEKDFLNWAKKSDDITPAKEDRRLTLNALDSSISKLAGLIYDTTDASERSGFFDDIEGIVQGANQ